MPAFIENKRDLAEAYRKAFAELSGVRLFTEPDFARSNYWLNVLLLDEASSEQRDALLASTNQIGIMTRPAWTLMHKLPMFAACPRMDLAVAENLESRLINIPSSAKLNRQQAVISANTNPSHGN